MATKKRGRPNPYLGGPYAGRDYGWRPSFNENLLPYRNGVPTRGATSLPKRTLLGSASTPGGTAAPRGERVGVVQGTERYITPKMNRAVGRAATPKKYPSTQAVSRPIAKQPVPKKAVAAAKAKPKPAPKKKVTPSSGGTRKM